MRSSYMMIYTRMMVLEHVPRSEPEPDPIPKKFKPKYMQSSAKGGSIPQASRKKAQKRRKR